MNYKEALSHDPKTTSSINSEETDKTNNLAPRQAIYFDFVKAQQRQKDNVARFHLQLLSAIFEEYGNKVTFFDINGDEIDLKKYPTSEEGHKKAFATTIFYFKTSSIFRISHYLRSEVSLSTIRINKKVSSVLKKYNIRMKQNKWKVTEVNTKGIGALFMVNPRAISENDLLALLRQAAGDQSGELFRVTATMNGLPAANNSSKITTFSYEIQAPVSQIRPALSSLQKIVNGGLIPGLFVPYSQKFSNPNNYRKCMMMHNKYLDDHRIIPVVGISESVMKSNSNGLNSLAAELHQITIDGIKPITNIFPTNKTKTEGHWNIEVSRDLFQNMIDYLRDNLASLCSTHAKFQPSDFPSRPMVSFLKNQIESGSTTTNPDSAIISFDESISNALKKFDMIEENLKYHTAPNDPLKFNLVWQNEADSEVSELSPDSPKDQINSNTPAQNNNNYQFEALHKIIMELRQSNLHHQQQTELLFRQNQDLQQQITTLSGSYSKLLSAYQLSSYNIPPPSTLQQTHTSTGIPNSPPTIQTKFDFSTPTHTKDSSVKRTLSYSESVQDVSQISFSQKKQNNKSTPVKNSKNWSKITSTNQSNADLSMDSTHQINNMK